MKSSIWYEVISHDNPHICACVPVWVCVFPFRHVGGQILASEDPSCHYSDRREMKTDTDTHRRTTHTCTHLGLIKFRNSHLIALTPASLFTFSHCSVQSFNILSFLITSFLEYLQHAHSVCCVWVWGTVKEMKSAFGQKVVNLFSCGQVVNARLFFLR